MIRRGCFPKSEARQELRSSRITPMTPTRLPLHRYPVIRSRSVDEAVEIQASINTPVELEQLDRRGQFGWDLNRAVLRDVALTASRFNAGFRATALVPSPLFSLTVPVKKGGSTKVAGTSADLAAGRSAVMGSPFLPTEFVLGSGYEGRTVAF